MLPIPLLVGNDLTSAQLLLPRSLNLPGKNRRHGESRPCLAGGDPAADCVYGEQVCLLLDSLSGCGDFRPCRVRGGC